MTSIKVSIVIPVKSFNAYLKECLEHCLKLDYADFEIIVLPDDDTAIDLPGVKVIATGNVTPPKKRDMALDYAQGEILAFIDDDAYPDAYWLKNAVGHFDDPQIAAVCGPAITAPEDNLRQQASGLVYASPLVSSNFIYRYVPTQNLFVEDYPSCNFLIRKSVFKEIGGFNTSFWPGEDTILCLEITKQRGLKILYDPVVIVYHHRRQLFGGHLRQIANYALHRGYFVKKFPQTSRKLSYFIPSLFISYIALGALISLAFAAFRPLFFASLSVYVLLTFITSLRGNFNLIPLVFLGIISTHVMYGWFFLKGLISRRLADEL